MVAMIWTKNWNMCSVKIAIAGTVVMLHSDSAISDGTRISGKGSQLRGNADTLLIFAWSRFWSVVDDNLPAAIR